MNTIQQISKIRYYNLIASLCQKNFGFILLCFSGLIFFPIQFVKAEEVNLKCTANFEINRGELIKPDWEISYFKVNLVGLNSIIIDNGVKKEGRTLIRRNIYTIINYDENKIKTKYKIHSNYGTYTVEYPKMNRTLIGTCQKGRG